MDISLEVLLSTNIKRKTPCAKICWLGQEKESVFLVDEKQLNEIKLHSGSVKKTTSRLQAVLNKKSVVTLASSLNGAWLASLHLSGELFLWNKDFDCLQTVPATNAISQILTEAQVHSLKLYLCVSEDGSRVFLATHTGCVFLWELNEKRTCLHPSKSHVVAGRWTHIESQESALLPSIDDKEATVHIAFVKNEVLGDCCLCTFAFYSGVQLVMTFLALRWFENDLKYNSSLPYRIHWAQQNCSLSTLVPPCEPVKSRGALIASFSSDGLVLALAINQKDPLATQILFINTMNFITIPGHLRGCSSKGQHIPSRFLRSYWVGDMSWTADNLFLACMLKRGSLLLLTRLGELLTLTTFGCSVEFGPAEFIPLHPLITYRPPVSVLESHDPNNSLGSTISVTDTMRQRYSVTCHPRLPYLIVSDGYMFTALRFAKNVSSYNFMKSLLLDSAQRLESVRHRLQLVKPKKRLGKLKSLTSLKASLLKDREQPHRGTPTIPSFLQTEEETLRPDQSALQVDDDASDNEDFPRFCEPPVSFGRAEEGRLEFASMFDTMHASDQFEGQSDLLSDLHRIQKTLLTAWTVGITMRNLNQKDSLLHYTVSCLTHFLAVLQSSKCPSLQHSKPSKKMVKGNDWIVYMTIFQQCLTILHWDVAPKRTIGHIIKLTSETAKLILEHRRDMPTKGLLECFCLFKMVSQHLNLIYNLHYETFWPTTDTSNKACLDLLKIPIFEGLNIKLKHWSLDCVFKQPPEPVNLRLKSEKRLAALWSILYNQVLRYQIRLRKCNSDYLSQHLSPKLYLEEEAIRSMLCHIQGELQSAGEHLDRSLRLIPVTGEEYFLLGSYKESVEFWNKSFLDVTAQGGRRAGVLQIRYCLAILYGHLYNYNLNDAQGMCDQLVRALLRRSNLLTDQAQDTQVRAECEQDLQDVYPDAALAVIQSMARFMAAYFTNQPMYVFPPHNVCILPPLHIASDRFPRAVKLQHSLVAGAIRDQNLSSIWTVEYALDLLLVGGLVPEAAWLANQLGDWKMSVSMGVAYNLYQESLSNESEKKTPALPPHLTPAHTFQEKLQFFLGRPPGSETTIKDPAGEKHFTDPIEEEDADVLFSSVQEMLKAAVMANAEIVTETLHQLMDSAKELIRKLSGLVPDRLYLPAPPLYCPQPTSVSEEDPSDFLLEAEKRSRQKLSGVLQRILILLRAARCSLPAAQWYIKQIKRTQKIMQKIRAKASLTPLNPLPETLLNYSNSCSSFFKPGATSDLVSSSVTGSFRELCALCWMLHVRERLSYTCRQYQKARDNGKLFKSSDECDPCVTECCFEALDWACRMLPFTRVSNCEELIQDIILSLVSELPPVKKVAEILVKAFPHPDVVRVPLREKYHSVQQRLRHSVIKGPDGEEMMSVMIHNVQNVHVKALRRVQRNIGPMEMHLWESALGETFDEESLCYDKYSLGTSLSRSTLTDFGRSQVYSELDTLSEPLMSKDTNERTGEEYVHNLNARTSVNDPAGQKPDVSIENQHALPSVGTWEFERDDEEYTSFLEIFLSYLLEKDLVHYKEPGIPFLTTFSHHLREQELNSLVFDVHTTLKRKLGKARIQSVFRAGSCYNLNSDPCSDCALLKETLHQSQVPADLNPNVALTVVIKKPEVSTYKSLFKGKTGNVSKSGLFGLNAQKAKKQNDDDDDGNLSAKKNLLCTHDQYKYKVIQTRSCLPSEELGMELQAKFSNEAKLVEWMVRWSDKRLFWTAGKMEPCQPQSTAIRVKTSSAAILTSIWLLEKPYIGSVQSENTCKLPLREYIVAPVSQPQMKHILQRMGRMDAGDAGSESGTLTDITEYTQPDENLSAGDYSMSIKEMTADYSASPQAIADPSEKVNVKIPSDTEDDQEDQLNTEIIPSISVSIRSLTQQISKLATKSSPNTPDPGEPEILETAIVDKNVDPDIVDCDMPSVLQPASSTANVMPSGTTSTEAQDSHGEPSTQPVNTSEAVRQLFQDEMFRLLQLQQINFMSIMQVVGSSFAALPNLQHILQQSSHTGRNQLVNVPLQEHAAFPFQSPIPMDSVRSQAPPNTEILPNTGACTEKPIQGTTNSAAATEQNALHDESNKENVSQKLPQLSILVNHGMKKETIPGNLGLLGTDPSPSLPFIVGPNVPVISAQMSASSGFPLLKLHPQPSIMPLNIIPRYFSQDFASSKCPLPPREAWGPSQMQKITHSSHKANCTTDTNVTKNDIKLLRKAEENMKWAEAVRIPKRLSTDDQSLQAGHPVHLQRSNIQQSGQKPKSLSHGLSLDNPAGIPLLHLNRKPIPYFPSQTGPDSRAPESLQSQAMTPTLTLLKTHLPQQPQNLPIGPSPQLLPLQNLIMFEKSHTNQGLGGTSEDTLQLLKANIKPFEEVVKKGDDDPFKQVVNKEDSIKRQRRRTKQKDRKPERKASVTFRPEDSIIFSNNFDDPVQSENMDKKQSGLEEDSDFVIPLGTFESLLSKEIPGNPIPSIAAELHYMASTQKKAPEIRDASTNTDSERDFNASLATASKERTKQFKNSGTTPVDLSNSPLPASYTGAEIRLDDIPPDSLPPAMFLNLGFHNNKPEDKAAPTSKPDLPHNPVVQQYRSVIDTEEDVPGTAASVDPSGKTYDRPEILTEKTDHLDAPADLLDIAGSETHTRHPDNYQPRGSFIPNIPMERPRLVERIPSEADMVTYKMLSEDPTRVPFVDSNTRAWPSRIPRENHAISTLQEMDFQLTALQEMADSMERDFANTELLVNTIENLTAAVDPDVKDVKVSEKALDVNNVRMESLAEEDEELALPSPAAITSRPIVSFSSSRTSNNSRSLTAPAHHTHVDKSILDLTGLSDFADILNDLMEGGVSATELGLTEFQARTLYRARQDNASSRSPSKRTQKERRELQLWMKRKRRERLIEHRKKLEELREMEHDPFQPRSNANTSFTTNAIRLNQREKDEKDKKLLSQHHSHRVSDAVNLMQEILSETKQIPAASPKIKPSVSGTPGLRSSPKGRSSAGKHSLSSKPSEKRSSLLKGGFSQPKAFSTPPQSRLRGNSTFVLPKSSLDPRPRVRRAPSYPVHVKFDASLPGDRMSQITRRGLLSGRNMAKVHNQMSLKQAPTPSKSQHQDLKKSNFRHVVNQTTEDFEEERDVVSPWEVPDDINKILNSHRNSLLSQGSLYEGDDSFRKSKMDNSSESTGSILSKLDWTAIEDMVASIEKS
ncbi:JBTS17 isoform X3 [Pelobates cultripes]|uniref:JBTS17 isoform X3 n=1 Tax=Pelobates cultripes TaxID=61616 RepID=A0AAD1WBM9_PELCU|nr:JBTS17 isoform X3 [Pelobates cultripes]